MFGETRYNRNFRAHLLDHIHLGGKREINIDSKKPLESFNRIYIALNKRCQGFVTDCTLYNEFSVLYATLFPVYCFVL